MDWKAKVFVSYAHEDKTLCEELGKRLRFLERQGKLEPWYDAEIRTGTDWKEEIDKTLAAADLVLAIITPDFLASNFCYEVELSEALQQHKRGRSIIVPIVARPCAWSQSTIANLQVVPERGKPITSWTDQDEAWQSVLAGVDDATSRSIEQRARFAGKFAPEIGPFLVERTHLLSTVGHSAVARNLNRLKKAHPTLGAELLKHQEVLRALYQKYVAALEAAYDDTYSLVADDVTTFTLSIGTKHEIPIMSEYIGTYLAEIRLLDALSQAKIDHTLLGLPIARAELEMGLLSIFNSFDQMHKLMDVEMRTLQDSARAIIKSINEPANSEDFAKP